MRTVRKKIFIALLCALSATTLANETLPKQWDSNSKALYDLLVAQLQNADADYGQSIDTLVKFAKSQKDDRLYAKAFKGLLQTHRYGDAVTLIEHWKNHSQSPIDFDEYRILALTLNGEIDQATSDARKWIENDEGEVDEQALISSISLLVGNWYHPNVIKILGQLYEDYGDNKMLAFTYAKQLRWQGEVEKAGKILDKLIFNDPKNVEWLQEKSDIYRYALQLEKAESLWQQALNDYPNDNRIKFAYAQFLYDKYDYAAAEQVLATIENDEALMTSVDTLRMMALVQLDEFAKAEQIIQNARYDDDAEQTARNHYNLAENLLIKKQYALAKKHYEAIDEDSYLGQVAAAKLGQIAYVESLKAGEKQFKQVAEAFHLDGAELVRMQANAMQDANRKKAAYELLDDFLKQNPKNAKVRYQRALLAADMYRDQLAVNDLELLYTAEPDNIDYQNALGYTLLSTAKGDKKSLQEAKVMIDKALFAKPASPAIIDSMGWVLYQQGKYTEALPYFRYAYANFVEGEIIGHYIATLVKAGQVDKARKLYQLEKHYSPNWEKINYYTQSVQDELND